MRRFIPLVFATAVAMFGGGGLLVRYELNAEDDAGIFLWQNDREMLQQWKSETELSIELDQRLYEVGRRLDRRLSTTGRLFNGSIGIPAIFEIYRELNRQAGDPLHNEDECRSEFERLSWISHQIRTNLEHVVTDLSAERADERRRHLKVSMDWMLADL